MLAQERRPDSARPAAVGAVAWWPTKRGGSARGATKRGGHPTGGELDARRPASTDRSSQRGSPRESFSFDPTGSRPSTPQPGRCRRHLCRRRRPDDELRLEERPARGLRVRRSVSASSSSAAVRPSSWRGWRTELSGHGGRGGELDVVVADDRDVVGHVDARAGPAAAAGRGQAGRWRRTPRSADGRGRPSMRSPARRPSATVERRRSATTVSRRRCGRGRASRCGHPRAGRRPARCLGPPTNAMRCVPCSKRWRHGQLPALDVVHRDGAPGRRRHPVDQDHRHPASEQRSQPPGCRVPG